MTSIDDAKTMARRIRKQLQEDGNTLSHGRALELVAQSFGYRDWNTFVSSEDVGPIVVPILRTFPGPEASRFYFDFLGFHLDWEHRFEPGMPLYRQVSMDGVVLHLSEHHGDATPGAAVRLRVPDVMAMQRRLTTSDVYPLHIGITSQDWADELVLPDPFGNRLVFHTPR